MCDSPGRWRRTVVGMRLVNVFRVIFLLLNMKLFAHIPQA